MMALAMFCLLGLAAGFLLLLRGPVCDGGHAGTGQPCSIIIPARNEAQTLPRLLGSLPPSAMAHHELLVVDDHSTDGTAVIAAQHGARIVTAPALHAGWTGKTSACAAGALAARADLLLFLDADTWCEPGGFNALLGAFRALGPDVALSVAPFHVTHDPYEELSLFFNLMTIFAAGGFGVLGRGQLFGQSLLLSRSLYTRSGGHEAVRGEILENLALAPRILAAGGRTARRGGQGVLHMRMFPGGVGDLCEGWTKAFAAGAAATGPTAVALAVCWLTALCSVFLWLLLGSGFGRGLAAAFYLCAVLQIAWFARQVGSFRWYTFAMYPIPLIFFFIIFARSLKRRLLKQQVTWKGRQL